MRFILSRCWRGTAAVAILLLVSPGALADAGGPAATMAPAIPTASLPAMTLAQAPGLLAELPGTGNYISWMRVVLILVCILPWLSFCQWVDKDTVFVRRMNREMWNGVVLAGGVVGLAVWLLMPWKTTGLFAAGFGLWFVVTAGTCCVYVVMRNNLVDPAARVFTPRHIRTWMGGLGKKKEERMDAVERVKLTDHDGKKVPVPEDPNQQDAYEAAQALLFDALWRRATEVEMMVAANGVRVAYRIDGVVTPRHELFEEPAAASAGLTFVKTIAGLDVEEKRRPQNGKIRGGIAGGTGGTTNIEVISSGTTQHERLSLRIVGDENRLRVGDLGLLAKQVTKVEELAAKPGGLVVVAGPKASGVTTTLYAALRQHDAFMQNLLSLERQRLMELENITQHIYDPSKSDASFARQLQTVLRREPDVVMVSDCPDRETAHLVAKAADGKKIYLGMQAKDSFDALKKLVSLAGDTDAVAAALHAVISQRLARKLCIACRQAYKPDPALLKKANLPADKIEQLYRPPPDGLVDAKGNPVICTNCQGSGYFGRTGIFEVLEIDDPIREMIRNGQPVNAIRTQSRANGMLYLQEVGLQKVIDGVTSMHEVLRVLRDDDGNAARKEG